TATLVLFTSGLSALISILARRPRDAILATYGLGAIWLLVPLWIKDYSRFLDGPLWWVPPVNDALLMSNPVQVWLSSTVKTYNWTRGVRIPGGPANFIMVPGWTVGSGFEWDFGWMAGIQAVLGLFFLVFAVAGLRPLRGSSWPGG